MFSSEPNCSEMDKLNSFLFSGNGVSSCKTGGGMESEFLRSKEMMGSDIFQQQPQFQHQQQQQSGGLARYRSAPSSFFAGILDGVGAGAGNVAENFVAHDGSSSSDSESMFSALLNCNNSGTTPESRDLNLNDQNQMNNLHQKNQVQFGSSMKQEIGDDRKNGYESGLNCGGVSGMGSYDVESQHLQSRVRLSNGNGGGSNLIRQSSSPAGFFSGFDVGNYRGSSGATGEASSSANGFNNHMNYSSAQSSSSNFMPSIAENGSWNDSSYSSLKRNRNGDLKMFCNNFNGLDSQNGESGNNTTGLAHQLSLPKTSSEMAAIEKYLQFQQDSVPCKIRAKRGFATHPRSIAERMRRIRISERMKKLQELFPDMDKQTNTADMLDLAVEYIKDLQKQVQTLGDRKAKCSCSSKQ